jgi:hypothetical protein
LNPFQTSVNALMKPIAADSVATSSSNPYSVPTLLLTTIYHSTTAFYTYDRYNRSDQTAFALAAIFSTGLASMGIWVSMFGSSAGRISKRTGADKRTSGWPFKNLEASKKNAGKKFS